MSRRKRDESAAIEPRKRRKGPARKVKEAAAAVQELREGVEDTREAATTLMVELGALAIEAREAYRFAKKVGQAFEILAPAAVAQFSKLTRK